VVDETRYGYFDPWFSAVWVNFDSVTQHHDVDILAPLTLVSLISPLSDDHQRYVRGAAKRDDAIHAATWF
jgi:hypothetical protein